MSKINESLEINFHHIILLLDLTIYLRIEGN